jgi:primosomal protein N' (replication factor Y)
MAEHPYSAQNNTLSREREEFLYPPFVRLIKITVKSPYKNKTEQLSADIHSKIISAGVQDFTGPTTPPLEIIDKEYHLQFLIKLKRDRRSIEIKERLYQLLKDIPSNNCIIDVDPINA